MSNRKGLRVGVVGLVLVTFGSACGDGGDVAADGDVSAETDAVVDEVETSTGLDADASVEVDEDTWVGSEVEVEVDEDTWVGSEVEVEVEVDEDTWVGTEVEAEDDTWVATVDVEVSVEVSDPDPIDPLTELSDDFEDPASLDDWHILSVVDQRPATHDTIDIGQAVAGALTLDPNTWRDPLLPAGPTGAGWFEDYKGPFVFKEITGDFVVIVEVQVGTTTNLAAAPTGSFNAGGIVARDPASTVPGVSPDAGDERWVMYNIGNQNGALASEVKTTYPASGGSTSRSSLFLDPISTLSGRIAMCRLGDEFFFFRALDGTPGWVQEAPRAATIVVNNAGLPWEDLASGFDRPDLPDTLQVGLMANRWTDGDGAPVRAVFREVTFATPTSLDDCTPD